MAILRSAQRCDTGQKRTSRQITKLHDVRQDVRGATGDGPRVRPWLVATAIVTSTCQSVEAYVGPGAGLAVAGGIWGIVLLGLALLAALLFPFRFVYHRLRDRPRRQRAQTRRVVVVGFDGLDAHTTRELLAAGHMPICSDSPPTAAITTCAPCCQPSHRPPGPPSPPASTLRDTRSSISSLVIRRLISPCWHRPRSCPAYNDAGAGRCRCCEVAAAADHSGKSWPIIAFSASSCGCPSRGHLNHSADCCCLACRPLTCAGPRERARC